VIVILAAAIATHKQSPQKFEHRLRYRGMAVGGAAVEGTGTGGGEPE
jgi:hypothetical protein